MSEPRCVCRNHMKSLKNRYSSKEAALKQAMWHMKRARGATFTIVTCKTDPAIYHIISSREAKK
ncbi:hypothetical protein [Glutamicibacter sp. ZJUTW]|uniref:hypothetical protein n=1 Tax=Glutamicibacter sp. ZJUTW TaxID=1155384 RepID=UPI0011F1C9E3|nr:hypothetical protein [Glutamicibacter sp. ZJUTW]QEP06172.1 hypothetical protein F0M17_02315 [Glutamicibacter sp. ZJUTW]